MKLEDAPVVGHMELLPDGLDESYWSGLNEGVLRIQRCRNCSKWIWGPQLICPDCLTFEPDWVEIEATGRIYSWTRTWQKFAPEFTPHVPYISLVVELPHAGDRRLLGLLVGEQDRDPRIGEDVTGAIQSPSDLTTGFAILRWQLANP